MAGALFKPHASFWSHGVLDVPRSTTRVPLARTRNVATPWARAGRGLRSARMSRRRDVLRGDAGSDCAVHDGDEFR